MTFEIEERGGVRIIPMHGELAGDDSGDFVEAVTNLLGGPGARIVLDLHDVQFMRSDGLGVLVRVTAQANVQEGRIILANPSPFVAGVLSTTRLDRFFEICPTVDDAIKKLG
jgi:anti-sigma B factor antagonist